MKRLGILMMALAALTALSSSCAGGEEEAGILAVAFRLDEGSPVMVAYTGDPAEDPFQLSPGRYYIEALDQDDVVVSLGAVSVKDGEAVDLPSAFAAAGGAADPERAEPLKTLANFLVDAELAEYAFLEIVSDGFERPLFDPDVEVTAADVETLFGMYEEILAQKDGVLAAFRQIQGRAQVSGHSPYVSSRWAQDGEDLDRAYEKLGKAFSTMYEYLRAVREEEFDTEASRKRALLEQTNWVVGWYQDFQCDESGWTVLVEKSPEMVEKHKEWEAYAKNLVQNLPGAGEEAAGAQAEKALADTIRSDLKEWAVKAGKSLDEYQTKKAVEYFVKEVSGAAGWPAGTPVPAAPDTSWIESYVQVIGEQWVDEGYEIEAVEAVEDLKACLTKAVEAGASRDEAIARCPAKAFKPKATPQPTETPAAEETETPPPEPTETPAPEETETPAPEPTETPPEETEIPPEPTETPAPEPTETPPTETPTPPGQQVTASGGFDVDPDYFSIAENWMTLTFNPGGGSVSGDSRLHYEGSACPDTTDWWDETAHFEGTYSPDSRTFTGTATWTYANSLWYLEGDPPQCVEKHTGDSVTIDWSATFEGGVVTGSLGSRLFQLTVPSP